MASPLRLEIRDGAQRVRLPLGFPLLFARMDELDGMLERAGKVRLSALIDPNDPAEELDDDEAYDALDGDDEEHYGFDSDRIEELDFSERGGGFDDDDDSVESWESSDDEDQAWFDATLALGALAFLRERLEAQALDIDEGESERLHLELDGALRALEGPALRGQRCRFILGL